MKKIKFLKHLFILPIIGAPLLAASCNISDEDKLNAELYLSTYATVLRNDLAPKIQNSVSNPGSSFQISNAKIIAAAKKIRQMNKLAIFLIMMLVNLMPLNYLLRGRSGDLVAVTSSGSGATQTYTIKVTRALFLLPITDVNLNVSASLEFKGTTFTTSLPPTHELVSQLVNELVLQLIILHNTDVSYFGKTNGVFGLPIHQEHEVLKFNQWIQQIILPLAIQ